VILIKKDALVLGGATPIVYKLAKNGDKTTVVQVAVKTGSSVGSWIEVTGSLQPGDQVVTQGNERLRPDQEVSILKTNDEAPPVN
jgi:multidrug efflux pump subunit AcrA (membrane-fusion protein)